MTADGNIIGMSTSGGVLNPANLHLTSTIEQAGSVEFASEIAHPDGASTLTQGSTNERGHPYSHNNIIIFTDSTTEKTIVIGKYFSVAKTQLP